MLRCPDVTEIMEYSVLLGLGVTAAEAATMEAQARELVATLETFLDLDSEQEQPVSYPRRDPGYRPTAQEDPLRLFIRRCHVEGADTGPLRGKTIGLKDHIAVAGVPMTIGSRFMEGYTPDFDATIVTRLLSAGGTIVGKLATDAFSTGGAGMGLSRDYARPLNPHSHDHLTGGSSSGSGGAVAAALVDIAFGGDQAGSIRIPASWCGVLGLKATWGLIPHTGVVGIDAIIDHVGPMARTVEDLANALESVAGQDGQDTRQGDAPTSLPRYSQVMEEGIKGLRIGLLREGFDIDGAEPDVDAAVKKAVVTLERVGATVEEVSVGIHRQVAPVHMALRSEAWKRQYDSNLVVGSPGSHYPLSLMQAFGRSKHSHGHQLPLQVKMSIIMGTYLDRYYHGMFYAKAQNMRPALVKAYKDVFAEVDLLAMPTTPVKAQAYREPRDAEHAAVRALRSRLTPVAANTLPFNITGYPALNVPCGKSEGLPIGLQLVAPYFKDDVLLRAAYAYQHSTDWGSIIQTAATGA